MPTGYTADVADGKVKDFRTFALRCARNFGACIMQRDDSTDTLPELRKEAEYYTIALAKARKRVAELATMTPTEANAAAERAYQTILKSNEGYAENRRTTRERYEAMLAEVVIWQPPTPDHEGLKKFMEKQLVESIDFDTAYVDKPPAKQTGAAWLASERQRARDDLTYALKTLAEEKERVAKANEWITALYTSLESSGVPA